MNIFTRPMPRWLSVATRLVVAVVGAVVWISLAVSYVLPALGHPNVFIALVSLFFTSFVLAAFWVWLIFRDDKINRSRKRS